MNGQNKCPKCGSTDIHFNPETGKLKCGFCRYEYSQEVVEEESTIHELKGTHLSKNIDDIFGDDVTTFKCQSCGAEVIIDTSSDLSGKCHWCRHVLSINEKIPNGAVPDMVLPFGIKKEDAKKNIEEFVKKRQFFAHPQFKKEFTTENVLGAYFPYAVVDLNVHSKLKGQGEVETRKYTVQRGDDTETRYDADLYDVQREFDLTVDDLTIESSKDKLDKNNDKKTTNIINSIMPFDLENCVNWDAYYLRGYSSEKRDMNVSDLENFVNVQTKDIARHAAIDSCKQYDRGIKWEQEDLEVVGSRWKTAYLPVWLYSYMDTKKQLHYVAVNARTKETMGSVPINYTKLFLISFIIEILAFFAMLSVDSDAGAILLSAGFVYYFIYYNKYRNKSARHYHEKETKTHLSNLQKYDNFVKEKKGLSNGMMIGANNKSVSGHNTGFTEDMKKLNLSDVNKVADKLNTDDVNDILDMFK